MSAAALFRRSRMTVGDQFELTSVDLRAWWLGLARPRRAAFVILTVVVLTGTLAFTSMLALPPDPYTEFYMLGTDQVAGLYPGAGNTGTDLVVHLGIVNHEAHDETYTIVVMVDQKILQQTPPIGVPEGQRWENDLSIARPAGGLSHIIEYELLRSRDAVPYRTLRVVIPAT